jgi:hypothetical protein
MYRTNGNGREGSLFLIVSIVGLRVGLKRSFSAQWDC